MRSALALLVAATLLILPGCTGPSRGALGDANVLMIVAPDSVWSAVETDIQAALEPRIYTVREERTFEVRHISPGHQAWPDMRGWRNVIPIGRPDDFWVEPALDGRVVDAPAMIEAEDVWARDQQVIVIVVPESDPAQAVRGLLPQLSDLLDARFRQYALGRMYFTDVDTALADSLAREAGFSLYLPNVYDHFDLGTTHVFRHHAEMGGVINRNVAVTWRDGTVVTPTQESVLAWRDSLATVAYDIEQVIQLEDRIQAQALESGAFEVQGVWKGADPAWPMAGVFLARVITCPATDRTYLVDSWLFAPGKDKYEYMIQLQTILNTFECAGAAGTPGG